MITVVSLPLLSGCSPPPECSEMRNKRIDDRKAHEDKRREKELKDKESAEQKK
jgi:hypothetical protein